MGITIFKIIIWGGYTFGNHVLLLRLRVAAKLNFRPYIRRYTSLNENFEYSYPLNIVLTLVALCKAWTGPCGLVSADTLIFARIFRQVSTVVAVAFVDETNDIS